MDNSQRVDSISNAHVGKDFEDVAREIFARRDLELEKNFRLPVGVGEMKKDRRFDLGSESSQVIVECKSHRWTKGDYVPSAKMTVWNEAMYYFHLAPENYQKILFVLRHYSPKKKETLAEYYIRTYAHLIPNSVEIWEYDEEPKEVDGEKAG
jgi:hypothetical protein